MNKIAALFPGQGSQFVGMAKALVENFPWTRAYFEEASDALSENLLKLCLDGPADKLQLTENAQPAILVTSYAWFQVAVATVDFKPAAGAGHSLGEYTALTAAGALTLTEAVHLVRARGQLMQNAVPLGKGKMAALLGLADDAVIALCSQASKGDDSVVVAANFNAPSQVVIAGHTAAVERAEKLATGETNPEWKARKIIPLNVSAPFHSPLMNAVTKEFLPHLKAIKWKKPVFPIVNNLDAVLRSSGDWATLLQKQIDHPVLWTACAKTLETEGTAAYIEVGPGKVLAGLVKRCVESGQIFGCDSTDDVKKLETAFRKGI